MPDDWEKAYQLFEAGKDYSRIARRNHHRTLERYAKSGVVRSVKILVAPNTRCLPCLALKDRIMPIAQALNETPLPVGDCTTWKDENGMRGWCRCAYAPIVR